MEQLQLQALLDQTQTQILVPEKAAECHIQKWTDFLESLHFWWGGNNKLDDMSVLEQNREIPTWRMTVRPRVVTVGKAGVALLLRISTELKHYTNALPF